LSGCSGGGKFILQLNGKIGRSTGLKWGLSGEHFVSRWPPRCRCPSGHPVSCPLSCSGLRWAGERGQMAAYLPPLGP
jgi:hypothetical protein